MPRYRRDLVAAVVAAGLLTTACVAPHRPGVSIDTLDADIVFGLQPPAAPPSPPGVPQLAAPAAPAATGEAPAPPQEPQPHLPALQPANPALRAPCPTAREGSFPQTPASESVTAPPVPALYRWKPTPPEVFGQDAFPVAANQFILRSVTDISPVTKSTGVDDTGPTPTTTETSTFTYWVVTQRPDGTRAKDEFKVEEKATRGSAGTNIGPTTRFGDPSRGVSLILHQEFDANGAPTTSFDPPDQNPLLLLPLDVVSSERFQSVASDPVTGATYTLTGLVNKRSMVDACGEEVDGWEVDAQTSFTYALHAADGTAAGTVTQTAEYTYYIATQLGGILTYEKVVPLQSVPTPPTGTALDGILPPSSTVPANPLPAIPYEISLASAPPAAAGSR